MLHRHRKQAKLRTAKDGNAQDAEMIGLMMDHEEYVAETLNAPMRNTKTATEEANRGQRD